MGRDEKTDRFRPVFEPEDIFDRFVKNANASTDGVRTREDEPTGQIAAGRGATTAPTKPPSIRAPELQAPTPERRGGPPSWDHQITVLADPDREAADRARIADAPTPMRTVAEDERGTVRVRSPYGEDPSKTEALPDHEVDEDAGTRVARSPLTTRPPTTGPSTRALPRAVSARPRRPLGLTDKVTEVQTSQLQRALAGRSLQPSAELVVPADEPASAPAQSPPAMPPREGTRPDAPMPLAMARAFDDPLLDLPEAGEEEETDDLTVPRASPLLVDPGPGDASLTDSGQHILLLTKRKQPTIELDLTGRPVDDEPATPALDHDILADLSSQSVKSVVAARGQHTQRLEAMQVIPDVEAARRKKEGTAVVEGGEDGQMPTRQLDQILADMAVLLRYGHADQVRERLGDLRRTYPEDLLLLRAIAEFFVENEVKDAALDTLFVLAGALFERRNLEGMRQALEQVRVLDPDNERAYRLLGLLEQRSG